MELRKKTKNEIHHLRKTRRCRTTKASTGEDRRENRAIAASTQCEE
jgi:hypothetical protein